MKTIIATLVVLFTVSFGFSQEKKETPTGGMKAEVNETKSQIVEASCGQCKFGMVGKKGCDLAVKIDNKTYFVDGVNMNDHGDAHGHDGMCNTIRKAEVTGAIKGDRFAATSFKLLPVEGHKHDAHDGHKH